jgi:ERCC4-type nuclease
MNAKYNPIEVTVENLPLSDIIIKDKNNNELILIERKSINDLASSIQDGRYNEQSYRLDNTEIHNHNIIYLIEGNLAMWNNRYSRITQDTIYSAMVSLMYYKGFSVFRTYTLVETAEFTLNMALKINKSIKLSPPKRPYFQNINFRDQPKSNTSSDSEDQHTSTSTTTTTTTSTTTSTSTNDKINIKLNPDVVESTKHETVESIPSLKYSKYVKREKKSNITPENIDVIMLSQIPHVSVDTAMQILSRHGTIYKLINTLKETPDALKTFMVKTKSGTRKLSSKTVSNIKTFLTVEK